MENNYSQFWQKNRRRNLWQHPLWADFQKAIGRETHLLTTRPGDIHASALIIKHPLPLGLCWLEIPRGPLWEASSLAQLAALLDQIIEYGKDQGAVFVRYSPYNRLNVPDRRLISWDHQPEHSLVLDISMTEEQLLAQMKPKGRYNIRLAEKHGIFVQPSRDVAAFFALLQKTGARDRFGIHPQSYYQKMLDTLGSNAELLLAMHQGKPVAGGLFVYLDDWGIYYYGASDYAHRDLMAPYLLQWTAIREAKKRGCKNYDFLGIAANDSPNHPWAGVTEFKKKFGGTVVHYEPAQELSLRPLWYGAYRLYKKIKT